MLNPDDPLPRAWPFEEAQKLAAQASLREKPRVLFETGYGPSGLPHIGTFGEVARTSWVRRAYEALTGQPTTLLAFSDDMDGLRRVPDNVPDRERLASFVGQPLSRIPDPFGTHASYAAHNNAELRRFLDRFGFDYEFASATDYYVSGRFDTALRRVLEAHDEIIAAVAPTLGPDRRATYSPILPIHPRTGVVMQVPIEGVDAAAGTVVWRDEEGERFETSVTGGRAKCQWKADWAMRWFALGVDYEMSGKDLIDSVKLSGKICRILGGAPPLGFTYELFLDASGKKISKSKGNGLTVDDWLHYAPAESLSQFMYNQPQRAKRLHFDVIPRAVDDIVANASALAGQGPAEAAANPAWHVLGAHRLGVPVASPIPFGMLLNLASVANAETPATLWGFLQRYVPGVSPERDPFLARLLDHAIAYYVDVVRPAKAYRAPSELERAALADLRDTLAGLPDGLDAESLQTAVYAVGKRHPFAVLRDWFTCLYQVLLGQTEGPRFGGFIALYGRDETVALIEAALAGRLVAEVRARASSVAAD